MWVFRVPPTTKYKKGNMADYYTNFSVILPLNQTQQEFAMQLSNQIKAHRDDNEPLPADFPPEFTDEAEGWDFDTQATEDGLWLHSQYGGQETACVFIQHLLQKFHFAPFVSFEWSHDCSKPMIDAYGGGAAFITTTEIETMTTSEWLQKMAELASKPN
jgi:hypothetical protein